MTAAAPTKRRQPPWVVVEQSARAVFFQVAAVTEKSLRLVGGEKFSRRRLWLADMPPPEQVFLDKAAALREQLDINDLWRRAEGRTLSLTALGDLAQAVTPSAADDDARRLAVMQLVLQYPMYFRRNGESLLTPLPAETLQKALASQRQNEHKKEQENELLNRLADGDAPAEIVAVAEELMHAPDKSAPPYRALKKHLNGDGAAFARFFINRGVLPDARAYWRQAFYRAWEATPTMPPPPETSPPSVALPTATDAAFSIDCEGTVEVDDAFSVEASNGGWRIGIHIAAPTLSADAEAAARRRLVSVYFPDEKRTMLPSACINACSLALNTNRAAVSLYLHCNAAGGDWRVGETVLQRVRLRAHLTPPQMDRGDAPPDVSEAFSTLKRLCRNLPYDNMRHVRHDATADFNIVTSPPAVCRRHRGEADTVVETLMRAVNSIWAERLQAAGIGGLYRRDGRTTTAPPREAPYMWLSSPLRRYVDLANQRLLLSLLTGGKPPPEDWQRLAAAFEQRHGLARRFQRLVERHWVLRALASESTVVGAHNGNGRVTLHDYPINGKWRDAAPARVGDVRVRVTAIDFLKQSVSLTAA